MWGNIAWGKEEGYNIQTFIIHLIWWIDGIYQVSHEMFGICTEIIIQRVYWQQGFPFW